VVSAIPSVGGALTSEIGNVVAAAFQGVLVLSLCELAGVDDPRRRVDLLSKVVLGSDLPEGWTADAGPATDVKPDADPDDPPAWQRIVKSAPAGMLSLIKEMWAIRSLSGRRPEGKLRHRALKMLPVVGVVGAVLGERSASSSIAESMYAELDI
jgi:hypothetical protein